MERTFHSSQWKWIELDINDTSTTDTLAKKHHTCKTWLERVKKNKHNSLEMYTGKPGDEVLWGSLVYMQDVENEKERAIFHFHLTREELVTVNLDLLQLDHLNIKTMREKLHYCETPMEGFLVLIGEFVSHFLKEIDEFETRLDDLLWKIKERNNVKILDKVASTYHELLTWKNLIIPILETRMATEEAFGDQAADGEHFKRAKRRIERAITLVRAYEEEIDALLHFESLVSAHRGNEIMKTLTVITTLFAPATVFGAIWGMNFKHMPELEWTFGYLIAGTLIVSSTLALYVYLRKKGWMGDILSTKSNKSFFK